MNDVLPKPIIGYENYIIHPDGKIFSKNRNKFINVFITDKGYSKVSIFNKAKRKTIFVHRLIAENFIGPRPSVKMFVNHIDGNKENNHYSNLEWITHDKNIEHAIKIGIFAQRKRRSKEEKLLLLPPRINRKLRMLTDQDVLDIRALYENKSMRLKDIMKKYKVTKQSVYAVVKRKSYKYL